MASTVAHTAFDTEATRRASFTALFPRSTCSTMVPCRITTAANGRLSDFMSQSRSPAILPLSIPPMVSISSSFPTIRQPPCDSGGGK